MMKLKSIAATALLGGLCIAATANTYNLGILDSSAFDTLGMLSDKYAANSVISDDWNFTIGTHSDVSFSALQTFAVSTGAISNFAGVLVGHGNLASTSSAGNTMLSWIGSLGSGDYTVHVTGMTNLKNAAYLGTVSASPAPEPETYAMLLAGLGVVGFLARRRRPS
jgi:hypothetical protein